MVLRERIYIELYEREVILVLLEYSSEINDWLRSEGVEVDSEATYDACCIKEGRTAQIVVAQDKLTAGILGHECFHAVTHLIDSIGMYLDDSSEEAYAYLYGYLFQKIFDILGHKL